jgi:predicted ATPase/class 3 adenylate cyclase/Tfp pilus assembly protein PilF
MGIAGGNNDSNVVVLDPEHLESPMTHLPTGAVTFLFTDIEGSTQLWEQHPEAMKSALAKHDSILRETVESNHGHIIKTTGDGVHAVFASALDAVLAVLATQRQFQSPIANLRLKIRVGLHTGAAEARDGDYFGPSLNRTARLMAVGAGGQILLSAVTAKLAQGHLPDGVSLRDLGEHHLKDLIHPEHIYQVVAPDLRADFPPLKSLDALVNNLPIQLTSFVGREAEVAEVKRLLVTTHLLTLTGSGGTGKTRLSLQAAADLLPSFAGGVWWVELAPLADPALIPQTVAATLGLRAEGNRPVLEALTEYLREKTVLLILDNCEHVILACARLAETLLSTCPDLRILASSREALGIPGEVTFRVPSLSLPDARGPAPDEARLDSEAARLFVERAKSALPDFTITGHNAPAIAEVCRRLDGIPLAIELAAARVNVLRVEQVAARLSDRFRLLTGGSRTALPRQQTLRAMMDWSYDLLQDDERLLLRRTSVFAGGWELEAAESICGWKGLEANEVLEVLTRLVNKSLVVAERHSGAEARYHLLETVRQYAREKLSEAGEIEEARNRHLEYFMHLAEAAEPELLRSKQVGWLKRLEDDFDNFRAALEWSQGDPAPLRSEKTLEKGLRLGSAIWRFCLRHGYAHEFDERLSQLLAHPGAASRTPARAKALTALSILCVWQTNYARARALAEESLALHQELGDPQGEAASLSALGNAARLQDDAVWPSHFLKSLALSRSLKDHSGLSEVLILFGYNLTSKEPEQAQAYLEEGLALARERGDVISMAGALDYLGALALRQGNLPQARLWLEESLAIQRPLGAPGYVNTLGYLGQLARYEGHPAQARVYCEEALSMSQNAGMTSIFLWSLIDLGHIALQEGQWEETQTLFVKALRQFGAVGRKKGVLYAVEGLASLAAQQRQPERTARLFAWAATARKTNDLPLLPGERAEVDRHLALAKSQLDDATFEALWVEGREMTMEKAIQSALQTST